LLTGDQNLPFQQNLSQRRLGVVVLCGASHAIEDLLPLVPDALRAIEVVQPGQLIREGATITSFAPSEAWFEPHA
jgi:hypothetical protein